MRKKPAGFTLFELMITVAAIPAQMMTVRRPIIGSQTTLEVIIMLMVMQDDLGQ